MPELYGTGTSHATGWSMTKSPGHQKMPDHKVREKKLDQRLQVSVNGEVLADSRDIIEVDEDESPPRYYFPRSDVRMDMLERSETETKCPVRGTASYCTVSAGGTKLAGAVWTYEDPYEEHRALKDRVAFYTDQNPEIDIKSST